MHAPKPSICFLFLLLLAPTLALAQPALTISQPPGPVRLGVSGVAGQDYLLQGTTNLTDWDSLLKLTLTNASPQNWLDASSVLLPRRFYRAVESTDPVELATDFRLTDHLGRTHWLLYYQNDPTIQTNVRAITLIFTGNGCQKIKDYIPTIKALTNRFVSRGVLFWLIDSNQQDNRSNILVEATSLGISNGPPILHDAAQLVGRAYHARTTPEAVAINTADFTIFYRGAIDDRLSALATNTTQMYLSNALVNFLAGQQPVSPGQSVASGCAVTYNPSFPPISYSTEIAPLLQAKCVRCHSPGNIAPWSMTNYSVVADHALDMRHQILAGNMPPWHADPYYSLFTNDYSLKPDEAAKLVQWINDGSPNDGGPDPLAAQMTTTNYPFAWPTNLGPPDVIYRIPLQNIPASGTVAYQYLYVTNTLPTNAWLRAAVVKPSNTRVVHHVLVFDGSSISGAGLDGFFAGYVPGADAGPFPPNTGKLVTPGEALEFQIHYITIGTPQTDQSELGLYIAPVPPTYPLQTKSAINSSFTIGVTKIPADTNDFAMTAPYPSSGTLATNILLFELDPHMHFRGGWFKYEVTYPAGHVPAKEVLLSVPNYVFRWQTAYRFTQPKYLPKGSQILCTGSFDNSSQNFDLMDEYFNSGNTGFLPSHSVSFGQQSWDEMLIGYLNYVEVPGPPP